MSGVVPAIAARFGTRGLYAETYAYPDKGQSAGQQQRDKRECQKWASADRGRPLEDAPRRVADPAMGPAARWRALRVGRRRARLERERPEARSRAGCWAPSAGSSCKAVSSLNVDSFHRVLVVNPSPAQPRSSLPPLGSLLKAILADGFALMPASLRHLLGVPAAHDGFRSEPPGGRLRRDKHGNHGETTLDDQA
jgi:hypothetical protein